MIAVNKLVQDVYKALGITGQGESTDGTAATVGCEELNRMVSGLNSDGFIVLSQKSIEVGPHSSYVFKKLREGEEAAPNVIDMEPPEAIRGVMRRLGVRYVPLKPGDIQQMQMKNRMTLPYTWNYGRDIELFGGGFGEDGGREVGHLVLDGRPHDNVKIFYDMKIPNYTLDDTIYLSDLYNELLFTGLKYRLACYYELSEQKKADCYTEFSAASSRIKRNSITNRMLQEEPTGGSYQDAYYNAFAPGEW